MTNEQCEIMEIAEEQFDRLLRAARSGERHRRLGFLQELSPLAKVDRENLNALAKIAGKVTE